MTNSLAAARERLQTDLGRRLDTFLAAKQQTADGIDPNYGKLLSEISALIGRGGKRLRPLLVEQAYMGCGGNKRTDIIDVAAAVELFHAFMLMHDDIIDRDQLRWGGPNIIGRYRQTFEPVMSSTEADHFANAWGLLAGDVCHSLWQELVLGAPFPPELVVRASRIMQQAAFDVLGGEVADIALSIFPDGQLDETRLLSVCYYKTATYSFIMPLQVGSLLAGADQQTLARIAAFGRAIGIAFQMQDDLLGMFGDEKLTGKSSLSDLHEGKRTLLLASALRLGSASQKALLLRHLGNQQATAEDLEAVRQVLVASGAQAASEQAIASYCDEALLSLGLIGFDQGAYGNIKELLESLRGRKF